MSNCYHLILSCPDRVGIVAAVSQFISQHKGLIVKADHYTATDDKVFLMRYEIDANTLQLDLISFQEKFQQIQERFAIQYQLIDARIKKRVLIFVSKEAHCLEDILYRVNSGSLDCDVVGVVSNHQDLSARTKWYRIPYHYIPFDEENPTKHFAAVDALIESLQIDLCVLARYMRILPGKICEKYYGKIINIHHSFLPSFMGASPYRQAFERGVKLIGATSHYVTPDLDQGPIIEQDVIRITHRQNLSDYKRLGQDIERVVLARALKAYLEDRILLHQHKTIVFS